MKMLLGKSVLSFTTVKKCVAKFKDRTDTSLEDDLRSSRLKSAATPEIISVVGDLVLEDRRVSQIDNDLPDQRKIFSKKDRKICFNISK
jgi:hypothetical protein